MIFQRAGKKRLRAIVASGRLRIAEQLMGGGNAWSAWNPGGFGIFWVDSLKEKGLLGKGQSNSNRKPPTYH